MPGVLPRGMLMSLFDRCDTLQGRICLNVERTSIDELLSMLNRNLSCLVSHTHHLFHYSRQRNIFYSRKGSVLSGNLPELWFIGKFCRLSSNTRRLGRLSGLTRFNPIMLRIYKGCQGQFFSPVSAHLCCIVTMQSPVFFGAAVWFVTQRLLRLSRNDFSFCLDEGQPQFKLIKRNYSRF